MITEYSLVLCCFLEILVFPRLYKHKLMTFRNQEYNLLFNVVTRYILSIIGCKIIKVAYNKINSLENNSNDYIYSTVYTPVTIFTLKYAFYDFNFEEIKGMAILNNILMTTNYIFNLSYNIKSIEDTGLTD